MNNRQTGGELTSTAANEKDATDLDDAILCVGWLTAGWPVAELTVLNRSSSVNLPHAFWAALPHLGCNLVIHMYSRLRCNSFGYHGSFLSCLGAELPSNLGGSLEPLCHPDNGSAGSATSRARKKMIVMCYRMPVVKSWSLYCSLHIPHRIS